MSGIEQQLQVPTARNSIESVNIARAAPGVDSDDARRPGCDHFLDLCRIEIVGSRIDIAEHWRNLLPLEGVGCGDECEGRNNHFTRQTQGPDSNLQRYRGIAHRNAIAHANEFGDSSLEILYVWAIVCKPIAIKHVIDSLLETFPASDIWSANVNLFGKRRRLSEDGEVLKFDSLASLRHQAHIVLYTTSLMPVKTSNVDGAVAMGPNRSGATKLLVIGSSGHAAVLVDAIQLRGTYQIAGYLDDTMTRGMVRRGYPILGALKDVAAVCTEHDIRDAVIAIGDNWWRRHLHGKLIERCSQLRFPAVLHPSAVVSESAEVGRGTAVLAACHIGPGSRVGAFCILNTGSSIDHDCQMRDFSSIGPGVFTGGLVEVGECSAVGVGASISDRISVGRHTVIGTGAVVVRNIPDLVVAYGNPARVKRSRPEGEAYVDTIKNSL